MLFESIVTNSVYYGIAYILYATEVWIPTLTGIALLFGLGMAFDSIVSLGAYLFLLKAQKINIFNVQADTECVTSNQAEIETLFENQEIDR